MTANLNSSPNTSANPNPNTQPQWLERVKFNSSGLIPAIAQDRQTGRILMMAWMNAEALALTASSMTAVYYSRSRSQLWHKGETSGHTQQVHEIRLDCDGDVIVLLVTQIGGIACHTGRESCFYRLLDTSADEPVWQTVDAVIKDPSDIYSDQKTHSDSHSDGQSCPHHNTADTSLRLTAAVSADLDKQLNMEATEVLRALDDILLARKSASADSSYVASLYHKGINKILEKVGEEAVESIIAAKDLAQLTSESQTQAHTQAQSEPAADWQQAQHELIYEVADVWFHTLVTLAWFNIGSEQVLNELARRFGLSGLDEKAAREG